MGQDRCGNVGCENGAENDFGWQGFRGGRGLEPDESENTINKPTGPRESFLSTRSTSISILSDIQY